MASISSFIKQCAHRAERFVHRCTIGNLFLKLLDISDSIRYRPLRLVFNILPFLVDLLMFFCGKLEQYYRKFSKPYGVSDTP